MGHADEELLGQGFMDADSLPLCGDRGTSRGEIQASRARVHAHRTHASNTHPHTIEGRRVQWVGMCKMAVWWLVAISMHAMTSRCRIRPR